MVSFEALFSAVVLDDDVLTLLPNLSQTLISAGVPEDHSALHKLLALTEELVKALSVTEAAVAAATMLGDVAAWGLEQDQVLTITAPLGTTLHVTVPSAAALAAGFSLGPFRIPALNMSAVEGLSVQSISWVTNVYAQQAENVSRGMVSFSARIHGQSIALTNLVPALRFTLSMTEQLVAYGDAGLISERTCVFWNTTAAEWRQDGPSCSAGL